MVYKKGGSISLDFLHQINSTHHNKVSWHSIHSIIINQHLSQKLLLFPFQPRPLQISPSSRITTNTEPK